MDFVLSDRGRPVCLIECKTSEKELAPSLVYFQNRLTVPTAVQLVHAPGVCQKRHAQGMTQWVISADQWLALLP